MKLRKSINIKVSIFLAAIFIIMGAISAFVFLRDLNIKEFSRIKDDNYRIVKVLTNELFNNKEIWNFNSAGIKETQDKFIELYKNITGQNIFLLNIYNKDSIIEASSFFELEGYSADNLNDNEIKNVLITGKDNIIYESLEENHISLYLKNIDPKSKILEIFIPVIIENKIIGAVETYFIIEIEARQYVISMAVITGISILVALIFMYIFFYRYIVMPINIIRRATYSVSKGEFSRFIQINQKDEIWDLADDFNRMIRGLNSLSGEITRLKDVGKMKSEFISIVAHQLRTPLSGIKWALETVFEKKLSNNVSQWLLKIQDLNERMIEIITDFLNAARIEEGKFGYNFEKNVDLIEILNKIVDSHLIGIIKKKINFSFPSKNSSFIIKADVNKLKIVFDNLLDNAIDYTSDNGSIGIKLQKQKDFVIVEINDTGIGIRKEDMIKLFTRFFRSKEAKSSKTAGSGIGLFVAKDIVKKHNGDILVESEFGKGSKFFVKLPIF
ncbi:MAG: HAMP domain-containing sensor histidine kinase [Patescibacteria group bacterium]